MARNPKSRRVTSGLQINLRCRARVTLFYNGSDNHWEWDGEAWTKRVLEGPAPPSSGNMVYDEKRAPSPAL